MCTIRFSEYLLLAGFSTPLDAPHILIRRISSIDSSWTRRSVYIIREECKDLITYAQLFYLNENLSNILKEHILKCICICPRLKPSLLVSITLVKYIFFIIVKTGRAYDMPSIGDLKAFHLVLGQASIQGCILKALAVSILSTNLYGV